MAEENEELKNDALVGAIASMVFGAATPPDDEEIAKAVAVLALASPNYRAQIGAIRNELNEGKTGRSEAAIQVVNYGLALSLGTKAQIDDSATRRALLEAVRTQDWITLNMKRGAIRSLAGHPADGADDEDAKQLLELAHDVKKDPTGGADPNSTPPGRSPKMPKSHDQVIDEMLEVLAFDEARLPERLHYATDGNGAQTPSEGQRNFLKGVGKAIQKLNPTENNREEAIAAVASLLLLDGHYDPDERSFYDSVRNAYTELAEPASSERSEMVPGNDAFESEFQLKRDVFRAVGAVLDPRPNGTGEKIFFHAVAAVYRGMVSKFDTRPPGSAGFASTVQALYNDETLAAGGSGGGGSGIAFLDLPPLSDPAGGSEQIVPENIKAISAIYMVYQCEQMLLFDVVDRIVELFMAGLLPMGGDALARKLDTYYWNGDDRVSKSGRMAQASRALGAPGGDIGPDVTANTDFNPTLMHVISSLAEFERQRNVGNLFEQNRRYAVATTGEYVRKSIRDLAANATLYGYAGAQFAAERMGRQLSDAIEILKLPRIQEIYGVNSMWQVIERVAQSEFGTTVNVVKHRTLAQETRAILEIVAGRHHVWSLSSDRPLFTLDSDLPGDLSRAEGDRLFRAAQYFLAVNGVQNEQVYEYSQPTDTPALPSIPGMGAFGGGGGMPAMGGGGGGDVAGQLKSMLDQGQAPSPDQLRAMVGF
ncbi:MAG: hypothetical protein QNI90_13360 [Dinoroseobacter sp.]|nr:hypothetical protein [Dinoroseobacter sp.]